MNARSELETSIRALARASLEGMGAPPSTDELLAYHRGELSSDDEKRIQEYLAHHPGSAERLLDLMAFPYAGSPGDPDYLSEEALAQDYEAILKDGKVLAFPSDRGGRIKGLLALAAFLILGLGSGNVFLLWRLAESSSGGTAAEWEQPRADVARQVLRQDGRRRGGPSGEPPIRLALEPSAPASFLVLTLVEPRQFSDYRLEILDTSAADSSVLWNRTGLRRRGDDTYEIFLPHGFLPRGRYQFRLFGSGPDGEELLSTYTVEITP